MGKREECYDNYWLNPDDECYDKYWDNPDTSIFSEKTRILFNEADTDPETIRKAMELVRMSLDWKGLSKLMAEDMPALAYTMQRGLRRAFYEEPVQDALKEFLIALMHTADRRMLQGNPIASDTCGECGSATHQDWCPIKYWEAASRKPKKRSKKKRTKRKTRRKNPTKQCHACKVCGKNVKQKKRGRPRLYHPKCKRRRKK